MRIAYLTAGAAGMYCGSCLHDNTLVTELLRQGEDAILVPIYTPVRTDEPSVSLQRVFFGGINVYLQQKLPLFRYTPRWLDRWLDHPALLRRLSRKSTSIDPAELGDLTVSMLRGEEGNQHKELDRLVEWLVSDVQPDVVHLSNSMMLGVAPAIQRLCGPPIVCSLSGEDIFLERLPEPYYTQARRLLRQRAADVQALVAISNYFAGFMSDYLGVARERIHTIPHGLNLEGHAERLPLPPRVPPRIGFLARICHDKGLHHLVEAGELLCARRDVPPFELHVAGYLGGGDRHYFHQLHRRANAGPLAGRFHYHGELDRPAKLAFLQSLDVFSTPTVYRESKGLPALEALANAVPVVLPDHGCFPELIADTGGGLLCQPLDSADLADKLARLLCDRELAKALGQQGRQAILARYHAPAMAERTIALYRELVASDLRLG